MNRLLSTLHQLFKKWYVLVLLFFIGFGLVYSLRSIAAKNGAPAISLPQLSAVFTPEVRHWSPLIYAWASAYQIDPNLIATVIQIESCGDFMAGSGAGAQGLFQVMPFHFADGEDMHDPDTNAKRGIEYLKGGLELADGHIGLAMAGYNGGWGVIPRGWGGWVRETRLYYLWGAQIYLDAIRGKSPAESAGLQSWLNAGGVNLCRQAAARQATPTPNPLGAAQLPGQQAPPTVAIIPIK